MYKPKPSKNNDLLRYAGLATQLFVSAGIAAFAGYKADKWLHLRIPILVWCLPLLVVAITIYKLIKETSKNRRMQKSKYKPLVPVLLLFILTTAFFISGKETLKRWQTDGDVLLFGNLFLFSITLLSYFISVKGLLHQNTHVFMRSVYGGMMIKMFITIIAAAVYIAAHKKNINKPALFTLMGLYLAYLFTEIAALTKQLKAKVNG